MAETDANLLRHFPLLLPQNRDKTVYEGFISAQVPPRGHSLSPEPVTRCAARPQSSAAGSGQARPGNSAEALRLRGRCGRGRRGWEGGAARRSGPEVGGEVRSVSLAESFPEFLSSLTTPQIFEIYRVLWVHY